MAISKVTQRTTLQDVRHDLRAKVEDGSLTITDSREAGKLIKKAIQASRQPIATTDAIVRTVVGLGKKGLIPDAKHDRVMETFEAAINAALSRRDYVGISLPNKARERRAALAETRKLAAIKRELGDHYYQPVTVDSWYWGPTQSSVRVRRTNIDSEARKILEQRRGEFPEDVPGHPFYR